MDWIYTAISWILLRWHTLWDAILPDKAFLATNWEWVLAIVFLVVTVRIILFPLFVKQIKSQRAMQALAPQVKALQEKNKGDKDTLQKEMMELYRKEKANPLMGCLPMFLQIPVFLGLFHVLKRLNPDRVEDWRTTQYGWTFEQFHDASLARLFSAPISTTFASGGNSSKIVAGVLVVIMIATTYMTSRQMILKTGWSEDPNQRMIQKLMLYGIPASLLFSGYLFPIGVVIYWVVQNLFSLGQQFWVLNKYPPPPNLNAGKTAAGGSARTGGSTRTQVGGRAPSANGRVGRVDGGSAGKGAATGKGAAGKGAAGKGKRGKASEPEPQPGAEGQKLAPKVGAKPATVQKKQVRKAVPKTKRPG